MAGDVVRVGVLMGGTSAEREISLASGNSILKNLDRSRYDPIPIIIESSGAWVLPTSSRRRQRTCVAESAASILQRGGFDLILIALHGPRGEDGTVQGLLECFGMPYTGSGVLASALAMHKAKAKTVLERSGLLTPPACSIARTRPLPEIERTALDFASQVGLPVVAKPADSGSSFGVTLVHCDREIPSAVGLAREHGSEVLIERWISGKEVSCGVLGNAEQGSAEPLPVTEILPRGEFFDFQNKYTPGEAAEYTPARLDETTTGKVQETAVRAHLALGCAGLSRVDMILHENDVFVLEVNTIPGMTENSLCPQQARAAGMGFGGLLDRIIELALSRQATRSSGTYTGTTGGVG